MPRVLATVTTDLGGADRAALQARCGSRRQVARDVGCNYWVFERAHPAAVLVEFFEARDEETLERARHETGAWGADHPILREVEF